jgi:ankyrin repeat protein
LSEPTGSPEDRANVSVLTPAELEFLHGVLDLARTGQTTALAQTIDSGLPVNLTNSAGDSLLILAAYHCHLETVQMLVARGADTERVNDRGQTALAAATFRHDRRIVASLLAAGADPALGARSALQIADFFHLDDMADLLTRTRLM